MNGCAVVCCLSRHVVRKLDIVVYCRFENKKMQGDGFYYGIADYD